MKADRILALVLAAWMGGGCVSVKLPLCPALAKGFPGDDLGAVINPYAADQANRQRVSLTALSPFVGIVSGRADRVRRFARDYPFMLCAFDPSSVIPDEQVFLVCMTHAPRWMTIVESAKPEDLMLQQTHFGAVCAP